MIVFHIDIPNKWLTNIELSTYAVLWIETFLVNPARIGFVTTKTDDKKIIYFDSFGQITPIEIQKYLKTKSEFAKGEAVIQRNTDIVQAVNTRVCGHLCLFVLKPLTNGDDF